MRAGRDPPAHRRTDRLPSTFTAFGATCAFLALGRHAKAVALWEGDGRTDWFAELSRGLVALASGDEPEAIARLSAARDRTELPRLVSLADLLLATALVRTGQQGAAAERLNSLWLGLPAPRLHRFALRFVTDADASALRQLPALAPALMRVMTDAAHDARSFGRREAPALSPVELQIVALMRRGYTNTEIATERFVSSNTVRTQVQGIFRKLGVNDRVDAVAAAERAGLLT